MDQLSKPLGAATAVPQPVSSSSREGSGATALRARQGAPAAPAPELVEACREASLRGARVEGIDCAAVLQQADAPVSQPSGEGVLLQMFGQRANVTTPDATASAATVNADAVARQLSTGNTQGNGAAEIAVRQQRDAPPPNRPR